MGVAKHLIEGDVAVRWAKRIKDTDYGYIYWHPLELQIFATVLAHYSAREWEQQDLNRHFIEDIVSSFEVDQILRRATVGVGSTRTAGSTLDVGGEKVRCAKGIVIRAWVAQ